MTFPDFTQRTQRKSLRCVRCVVKETAPYSCTHMATEGVEGLIFISVAVCSVYC